MTSRNVISAIFISIHLSVILVLLYVFFPVLSFLLGAVLRRMFSHGPHGPESNGIAAVAGGVSDWFLALLIVAPIVFIFIFLLLQKGSRRRRVGRS